MNKNFLAVLIIFICFPYTYAIDTRSVFLESQETVSVEKHIAKKGKIEISFYMPRGFSVVKSNFIRTEHFDPYASSICTLEDKNNPETFFRIDAGDFGDIDMDSLMRVDIGNVMPLFGDSYQTCWYNCGYFKGNPYFMISDIVLMSQMVDYKRSTVKNLIKVSFMFDIYMKTGFRISFLYNTICPRYNFNYERIMDIFKSIEIKEIKK